MKTERLEIQVEDKFKRGILPLIGKEFGIERLPDEDTGASIDSASVSVEKITKIYENKRLESFSRRFEERYGSGSVTVFQRIAKDPRKSLADIGAYFGFSREYARQVFRKINGYPYTTAHKEKVLIRKKFKMIANINSQRARKISRSLSAAKTVNAAERMGLSVRHDRHNRASRIGINGFTISTKGTFHVAFMWGKPYLRFAKRNSKEENVDFFVCVFHGKNRDDIFFVIPSQAMPKSGPAIPIVLEGSSEKRLSIHPENKYFQYKEAWHLVRA